MPNGDGTGARGKASNGRPMRPASPAHPAAARPSGRPAGHRVHMGTASSDPNYLPPTDNKNNPRIHQPRNRMTTLRYDRYLETPRSGRSIFTSRQERSRHRTRVLLLVAAIAILAAAAIILLII